MRRDFDDAFLFQHDVFREHPVDAAAERGGVHVGCGLAAGPALEEAAGDLVARLHALDARADLDHLARAVRQRHDVVGHAHAIGAAHDAEIAKFSEQAATFTSTWRWPGLGCGAVGLGQRVDARAALRQLIGTHGFTPYFVFRKSLDHFA